MSLFKDFAKNLGGTLKDAALNGLVQGLRTAEMNSRYGGVINGDSATDIYDGGNNVYESYENTKSGIKDYNAVYNKHEDQLTNAVHVTYRPESFQNKSSAKFGGKAKPIASEQTRSFIKDHNLEGSDAYKLFLPQWGYDDFINERNIFIKNFTNGYADPGWMYFKVFFKFNTQHGLLGGLLNHSDPQFTLNGAYKYLSSCEGRYKTAKLYDRAIALRKFAHLLSYINSHSPWFFKSVKNLNEAGKPYISEFTADNKSFELELAEDAIDMRISTLFSLYKFACFDDINCREIIPENLRKFDMCIAIFQSPLKLQHTPINGGSISKRNYKKMYALGDNTNTMSFKLYNFLNCEFDKASLGGFVPSDLTSDNPFQLGKNSVKINYDRVYEYTSNEFTGDLFGSDAYYFFSGKNIQVINLDEEGLSYPQLTIASEKFINANVKNLLGKHQNYALGNLYWQDRGLYQEFTNKSFDKEATGTKFLTEYAKSKFGLMKGGSSNFATSLGYDILYKLLGSSYKSGAAPSIDGTGTVLNGEGQLGVGSAVWSNKMERLKFGPKGLSDRERRMNTEYNAAMFDLQKFIKSRSLRNVKSII